MVSPQNVVQVLSELLLGVGFIAFMAWLLRYLHGREEQQKKERQARRARLNLGADRQAEIEIEKLRMADRSEARQLFERLSMEKLEILKQSVQMGYKREDLAELDARLERIIGSAELTRLLGEALPGAAAPVPEQPLLVSADLAPASSGASVGQQATSS